MRRRDLLTALAAAACGSPRAAGAQQPAPAIGFLSSFTESQAAPALAAVMRGLAEAGPVDGRDARLERRYAEGRYERLPALAAELAAAGVGVILASGRPAPFAARTATPAIPIVFVVSFDPVAAGLVESMSRPGGTITGITHMSDALVQKRVDLLLELLPQARRLAMLVNPESPDLSREIAAATQLLQPRSIALRRVDAKSPAEIDAAFAALAADRPDALLVAADPFFLSRAEQLVARAGELRLATAYPFREFSAFGGLISYGPNRPNAYRQAGLYASRILKGAKPADLPIMQPTVFDLVIHLRTAQALGLPVPPAALSRADEVIE